MRVVDQTALLKALPDYIALGRAFSLHKEVSPLEEHLAEFQNKKPTLKVLQGVFSTAVDHAFIAMRDEVYDMGKSRPRPGMGKSYKELETAFNALRDIIYPNDLSAIPESDVVGLAGNDESTTVVGDVKNAKKIAFGSLKVIRQFSEAVFKRDLEAAYALCSSEFRQLKTAGRFKAELERANNLFGGPPVDLSIERIAWIYGDDASRERSSNKDGGWPSATPKESKRSTVGGFWIVDKKSRAGRYVFFWITEEPGGYRVAKIKQYLQ